MLQIFAHLDSFVCKAKMHALVHTLQLMINRTQFQVYVLLVTIV